MLKVLKEIKKYSNKYKVTFKKFICHVKGIKHSVHTHHCTHLWFQVQHSSELIWHVLCRRSLNFCSCTTWFLDMDDLVRINRTWLHKEPKVSVLHANAKLIKKGECWTWNQRFRGSILTWGNILLLEFTYWEKYRCNRKVAIVKKFHKFHTNMYVWKWSLQFALTALTCTALSTL